AGQAFRNLRFHTIKHVDGSECAHPVTNSRDLMNVINRRVELLPIICELLQRADPRACAYDGYKIARLHLLVYVFSESVASGINSILRHSQVVNDQSDCAVDLFRSQWLRRHK